MVRPFHVFKTPTLSFYPSPSRKKLLGGVSDRTLVVTLSTGDTSGLRRGGLAPRVSVTHPLTSDVTRSV